MTAKILSFVDAQAPKRVFETFHQVGRFMMPDPLWVLEDDSQTHFEASDERAVHEYFSWYGVQVDAEGPFKSLVEGWRYLQGKVGFMASMLQKHESTYRGLSRKWSAAQHEYLESVVQGDFARSRVLVRNTVFWFELQEKMRTQDGCALRTS